MAEQRAHFSATWADSTISPGKGKTVLFHAGCLPCIDYLRVIPLAVEQMRQEMTFAGNKMLRGCSSFCLWPWVPIIGKKEILDQDLGTEGCREWEITPRTFRTDTHNTEERGGPIMGSGPVIAVTWYVTLKKSFSTCSLVYLPVKGRTWTIWSPISLSALRSCDFMN